MTWEIVDQGWGNAATVWAYSMEPRFWPEFDQVLRHAGVGEGTSHLDVACGSGFASLMASHRGATVHGLDASDRLLAIAAKRVPLGDYRHGDMHDLPWADETFDVVTSFKGIWGPNDRAVVEAARVLKPGGTFALSFFPVEYEDVDFNRWFYALRPVSEQAIARGALLGSIANEGRVEEMCDAAGLEPGERHQIEYFLEGSDLEQEVRGALSSGPAWTAVEERGQEEVEASIREELGAFEDETFGIRYRNVCEYLVATKPA